MKTMMMMRSTNLEQTSKCLGGNNAEWAAQSAKPIVIVIVVDVDIVVIIIDIVAIVIVSNPFVIIIILIIHRHCQRHHDHYW